VSSLRLVVTLLLVSTPFLPRVCRAQSGREIAGVPALNYDADEGFGYGVILQLYDYGSGLSPYRYMLEPLVFLTTGGRHELSLFFDAPHVVEGWRVDAYLARVRQVAWPFYGIGNDATYDPNLVTDANPSYYRFEGTRTQLRVNVQRPLGHHLRLLLGGGLASVAVNPVPKDSGTTLLARQLGTEIPASQADGGASNYVRLGLVRDTRDREIGPRHGSWTELLLQRTDRSLGSDWSYTRWTFSDRRYVSLAAKLVFAERVHVEQVTGDAPFYDLSVVESSFRQTEGLGGAKTVRGLPKDRYIGKGMAFLNAELRWRATEFATFGRDFHVVLSSFLDAGRVWGDRIRVDELLDDAHVGFGGGVRLGMGDSFVVALDVGHSTEATAPIYIGLGYLY
jgi:Omp85 superfamily domain